MNNLERTKLLDVILGLITQYMPCDNAGVFHHQDMNAGEDAAEVLEHYGIGFDIGYSIQIDMSKADKIAEKAERLNLGALGSVYKAETKRQLEIYLQEVK